MLIQPPEYEEFRIFLFTILRIEIDGQLVLKRQAERHNVFTFSALEGEILIRFFFIMMQNQ